VLSHRNVGGRAIPLSLVKFQRQSDILPPTIFCHPHPLHLRFRFAIADGKHSSRATIKINIILPIDLYSTACSVSGAKYTGLIHAEWSLYPRINCRARFIPRLSRISASQLAAISHTSERPISERLRQLGHSKDENVSLQSISALQPSLRVHLPHPRPLISLSDKLDYVRSAHILYSRLLSFTQNWIIVFEYVRINSSEFFI